MAKSWLSVPDPCLADWDAMARGRDGRTRHCEWCDVDLLDTTRMTAAEVHALIRSASVEGRSMPCINLWTRGGRAHFVDSPDVPVSSLRRRGSWRPAMVGAAAMAVMACKPQGHGRAPCHDEASGRTTCVEEDDHVDGEVLSPEGANMMSRGRARSAPIYSAPSTLHDKAFAPEPGTEEAELESAPDEIDEVDAPDDD